MNITTNCHNGSSEPEVICSFFPATQHLCGLSFHTRTRSQSCAALVDLQQVSKALEQEESRLPEQLLSEPEQAYFKRFSYPKRRREWLGGRAAAKSAMLELIGAGQLPGRLQQLSILPDDHGRPVPDAMPDIAISISHSDRFAVTLAVRGPSCGIDLQKISSKLSGLTDRFASAEELLILNSQPVHEDEATRLTMLWAAKEALKKRMLYDQPAIFSGIRLQRIAGVQDHKYCFFCSVSGYTEQAAMIYNFSPYILALTGAYPHA